MASQVERGGGPRAWGRGCQVWGVPAEGLLRKCAGAVQPLLPRALSPIYHGLVGGVGGEELPSCRMPHCVLSPPAGVMTHLLACRCPLRKDNV